MTFDEAFSRLEEIYTTADLQQQEVNWFQLAMLVNEAPFSKRLQDTILYLIEHRIILTRRVPVFSRNRGHWVIRLTPEHRKQVKDADIIEAGTHSNVYMAVVYLQRKLL